MHLLSNVAASCSRRTLAMHPDFFAQSQIPRGIRRELYYFAKTGPGKFTDGPCPEESLCRLQMAPKESLLSSIGYATPLPAHFSKKVSPINF
jgi:hypothetical protein